MADLTTLLSKFLTDLYSGTIGTSTPWKAVVLTNGSLGVTPAASVVVQNTTAAAAGAQQMSPAVDWVGQGWKTDATAASQEVRFRADVLPVQGTSAPTGAWRLGSLINGGAITNLLSVSPASVTSTVPIAFNGGSVLDGIATANIIDVRNGASPQLINLYNTYTDASNYERLQIGAVAGNVYSIITQAAGTGATRDLRIGAGGGYMLWNTSAQLLPDGANARSIGSATIPWATFYAGTSLNLAATNGQNLALQYLTELTTIAASATTDTTIQMPAGAQIQSVSVRVTTVIPTAATFTVGDSGSAARFSTAAVSTAATSTDPGTKAGLYYNASALSVRITPNATPAANTGRVRVTIAYFTTTPPTS